MRTVRLLLLVPVLVSLAHGQGTILFGNRLSARSWARIYDCAGQPLAGVGFSAQLFAGPPGAADAELLPVDSPVPFRAGVAAGSWMPRELSIPFLKPGEVAGLQVRVWDNREGALGTEAAAVSAGAFTLRSPRFVSLPLGGGDPPALPPRMVGNPDPANNLPAFDCSGALPSLRLAGPPVLSGGRLQFELEVAATEVDLAFALRRAPRLPGAWAPDPSARLERVSTNQVFWKYRISVALDDRSACYYRLSSR
jgi:hypothetical protein